MINIAQIRSEYLTRCRFRIFFALPVHLDVVETSQRVSEPEKRPEVLGFELLSRQALEEILMGRFNKTRSACRSQEVKISLFNYVSLPGNIV